MAQIKKDTSLRKAILQAAVTGRLISELKEQGGESLPLAPNVPFSATPSPRGNAPKTPQTGRQLLERIIKERNEKLLLDWQEALKTNPKAKKPAPVSASKITEEEIPFEIPENWCWCRLGDLGEFTRGSGIKRNETTKDGFPCVRYGEMYTTYKIRFSHTKSFTSKEVFDKCYKIHTNDVLMALTGENKWDIALAAVYEGNEELALGGDLCKFSPSKCNSLFLVYLINSPYGIEYKRNTSTGDIIVHTSTTKLANLLVPLPPLAVQNAIVAKLEQVLPLVDAYENAVLQKEELKGELKDKVKKAILQQAVQGKLVPQIAGEGSAKDLLAEIKKNHTDLQISTKSAGKKSDLRSKSQIRVIKKELPSITEDEIPFEIPESWCWCRITDIATCELGKTKDTQKNTGDLKDYLCSINIQEDGIDLSKVKQMRFEDSEFERYTVRKNDLLICEGGDAGRCAIYDKDEPMYYQNALHRVRFFNNISTKFYLYIFQLYKANKILLEASKGVTIQHLTGASLKELCFPLPPLAEQKRIVAAVEELLPLCEKLGR